MNARQPWANCTVALLQLSVEFHHYPVLIGGLGGASPNTQNSLWICSSTCTHTLLEKMECFSILLFIKLYFKFPFESNGSPCGSYVIYFFSREPFPSLFFNPPPVEAAQKHKHLLLCWLVWLPRTRQGAQCLAETLHYILDFFFVGTNLFLVFRPKQHLFFRPLLALSCYTSYIRILETKAGESPGFLYYIYICLG